MSGPARPLLVLGLRRSGTTALWATLRQHPDLVAFDEPFHPRLWEGARESTKGTWAELTALWARDPSQLAPGAVPILPLEELAPSLSEGQRAYLCALLAQNGGRVVTDVVRGFCKAAALASVPPGPHVVQIVRSPVPWVLSHLLPSGRGSWRKPIGDSLRRWTALRRRGGFDNWQYETIVDAALSERHPIWTQAGLDPARLIGMRAFERLLAFWWAANARMARDLAQAAPGRHEILLAEAFMEAPRDALDGMLARAGLPGAALDVSEIRTPRLDPLAARPAFADAFGRLGIPPALLPQARPGSEALTAALRAAGE